jgi:hypothetical protein
VALTALESAVEATEPERTACGASTLETLVEALGRARYAYDKGGEEHYNLASALIKSLRNSDAERRPLLAGAAHRGRGRPRLHRARLCILASEDIGLADPQAMVQAAAAAQITQLIGLPEALYPLSQATIYLAARRSRTPSSAPTSPRPRTRRDGARARAAAPAQRRHAADEARRLRQRLPLRPRRPARQGRDGLPARSACAVVCVDESEESLELARAKAVSVRADPSISATRSSKSLRSRTSNSTSSSATPRLSRRSGCPRCSPRWCAWPRRARPWLLTLASSSSFGEFFSVYWEALRNAGYAEHERDVGSLIRSCRRSRRWRRWPGAKGWKRRVVDEH